MAAGTLSLIQGLSGSLSSVGTLAGSLSTIGNLTGNISRVEANYDYYEGTYEVTPNFETQTLQTSNKYLTNNVVINPIPSNYGLITWNGSTLTVS